MDVDVDAKTADDRVQAQGNGKQGNNSDRGKSSSQKKRKCYLCDSEYHLLEDCPQKQN